MHEVWKKTGNFDYTWQRQCDQKQQITGKALLTEAKIQTVKQSVGLEEAVSAVNQQLSGDLESTPKSQPKQQAEIENQEDPLDPPEDESPKRLLEYKELMVEFMELLGEVQCIPLKERD